MRFADTYNTQSMNFVHLLNIQSKLFSKFTHFC